MNLGMISNYVKAKWSKGITEKKVDVTTKDIRLLSCFGNGDDIVVCQALRPSERKMGKFLCGECGCGDKATTWLNGTEEEYTKLDHPYLSCPRKMPGFSDYEPATNDDNVGMERKRIILDVLGEEVLNNKQLIKPEMSEEEKKKSQKIPPNQMPEKTTEGCTSCAEKAKVRNEIIEKLKTEQGLEPDFKNARYMTAFNELWDNDPRVIAAEEEKKKTGGCPNCKKNKIFNEIKLRLVAEGKLEGEELIRTAQQLTKERIYEEAKADYIDGR
jgi:hypothetical protein